MSSGWIGLDVGTTHTKAVVVRGHTVLAQRTLPTPAYADGVGVSRDPREVIDTVKRLLSEVTAVDHAQSVAGISVASMGEEVVLLDAYGTPVGPVISWFDRRGHDEARTFPATGLHERFPADPSWSLFKLLWLRHHRPAEVAATRTILDLGSFVLYALGAPPIMDWSHASRTGLFDPVVRHWDVDTLAQAELQRSIWPELVPSGSVLGQIRPETAAEIGIDPAALLVSGGHDHFVGAYGCGVRGSGDGYLSAGTSEALLVLTDRVLETRAGVDRGCYVDADHSYLRANTHGGHVYGQWRELLYSIVTRRGSVQRSSPLTCRVALWTSTRRLGRHRFAACRSQTGGRK